MSDVNSAQLTGELYPACDVTPGGATILIQNKHAAQSVRIAMARVDSISYAQPDDGSGLCDFLIIANGKKYPGSAPPDQIDLLLKVWERFLTPIYGVETR